MSNKRRQQPTRACKAQPSQPLQPRKVGLAPDPEQKCSQGAMEQLPDDVLVEVLKRLPVKDLLACRLVCKRLGCLALHRDVWRCKTVDSWELAESCPVLRLAPCLDSLLLRCSERPACPRAYTTSCAVRRLVLLLSDPSKVCGALVAIKQQAALGRLRALEIRYETEAPLTPYGAHLLLATIQSTAGLEDLRIYPIYPKPIFQDLQNSNCKFDNAPSSSIRNLRCREVDVFRFALARHAPTLEFVAHVTADMWSAVGLLAGLPRLRKLICDLHPGMDALVACTALTDLTIMVEREDAQPAGAVRLLGQACQLRKVALVHSERPSCVAAVEELLLALASPARPAAETLEVTHTSRTPWTPSPVSVRAEPLLGALSRLPALRELTLDWESDQLLRGVRPGTTPALMSLDLRTQRGDTCGHGWVHNEDFMAFMLANPSLHVRVGNWECDCEYCEDPDCHHQLQCDLWDNEGAYFYSHPEDQCPWQHEDDHVDDGIWVRIPLDS